MAATTPGLVDAPPQSVRVLHRVYYCCRAAWPMSGLGLELGLGPKSALGPAGHARDVASP